MSTLTAARATKTSVAPDARENILSMEQQERWRALVVKQHHTARKMRTVENYAWIGGLLFAGLLFAAGVLGVGWGTWAVVSGNDWQNTHSGLVFWGMLATILIGVAAVVKIAAVLGSWAAGATCWSAAHLERSNLKKIRAWWTTVDQDLRSAGRPGLRHLKRARSNFAVLDDGTLIDVRTYPEEHSVWLRSGYSSWITR